MHQSLDFKDLKFPHHVCRLNKSLYGLKQALCAFYQRITEFIATTSFFTVHLITPLSSTRKALLQHMFFSMWMTSYWQNLLSPFLNKLSSLFLIAMKDLGSLVYFLRTGVTHHFTGFFISQKNMPRKYSIAQECDLDPVLLQWIPNPISVHPLLLRLKIKLYVVVLLVPSKYFIYT